jgi:hypothetical protein
MALPQEQNSSGSREIQVVVTSNIAPGTIFESTPGGKPALYRGNTTVEASVGSPKRIAASVDFVCDIDCPTGALAVGDLVDYDIATKAAVAADAGDFALGKVIIAKAAGVLRVTVDTSDRVAAT